MKINFRENKAIIISLIALILSTATFIRDYCQNDKLAEMQYQISSNEYRPYLKIIGDPIIKVELKSNYKVDIKDMLKNLNDRIIGIPIPLELQIKLRITNSGNAYAKIFYEFFSDTSSGTDQIRDLLSSKEKRNRLDLIHSGNEEYKNKEIFPNDTTYSENKICIQYLKDKSFTIHFYILYTNELNMLYDTYYWAKYEIKEQAIDPNNVFISSKGIIFPIDLKEINNSFILKSINLSSKIFAKNESKDILQYLESNINR